MKKAVFKWLDRHFSDLEIHKEYIYPNSVFYVKNNDVIIEKNNIHPNYNTFVSYVHVISIVKPGFNLDRVSVEDIITEWVKDRLKIKVKNHIVPFFPWEDRLHKII